jgi:hypothetical protein
MHGLINRSIQLFMRDTYGPERWRAVARAAGVGPDGFEPMLDYDDSVTDTLLAMVATHLDKPESAVLEDLGTYLVSHGTTRGVRRLLRFSGESFADFLHSLDDLPSRARLAMPDLELPELELREDPGGRFRLFVLSTQRGWGYVMLGLLRAMADDYGALVMIEMAPGASSVAVIEITLLDGAWAEGRSFSLADAGADAPPEPGTDAGPAPGADAGSAPGEGRPPPGPAAAAAGPREGGAG